ncbi:MAG: hypothetical protein RLZZ416_471 [Candidatus Parcubacteria bacterium]
MTAFIFALSRVKRFVVAHKIIAAILAVAAFGGGYWAYAKFAGTAGQTRYVLAVVETGTIISTVSGSGQVSPSNQIDIKPKVSGDVVSLPVSEGQAVAAGTAIAYLDSTAAQKTVRDAKTSLESAKLSLEKLRQPADALTLTQAKNALEKAKVSKQNATDSLAKAYADGFNDVSDLFLDLPTVMNGLNTVLFGADRSLGGPGQSNVDFYKDAIYAYNDAKAQSYYDDAKTKYAAAKAAYDAAFAAYKTTNRSADTTSIGKLVDLSYTTTQQVSDALKSANNLIQLYQDTQTARGLTSAAISSTQLTTLGSYTSTINTHLSSLSSSVTNIHDDIEAIAEADRGITESEQSLTKTIAGTDPLDIRATELTVEQRTNALQDATDALADYTIRAPFDGTIAKLDAKRGDAVSSASTIATLITKQQLAELSLNEVDAAKLKIGDKATLTFDAIDGLSITGAVASVDALGTVSQGVVSYAVKIGFDAQDPRVKPGMTVNASIQTDVHQSVLMVPSSAVKTQNGQSYVQAFMPPLTDTAGASGVTSATPPQNIPVTTGISDDTNTEILSGLTEGQQVVTRTTGTLTQTTTTGGNRGFGGPGVIRLGG